MAHLSPPVLSTPPTVLTNIQFSYADGCVRLVWCHNPHVSPPPLLCTRPPTLSAHARIARLAATVAKYTPMPARPSRPAFGQAGRPTSTLGRPQFGMHPPSSPCTTGSRARGWPSHFRPPVSAVFTLTPVRLRSRACRLPKPPCPPTLHHPHPTPTSILYFMSARCIIVVL
ncbi:hypothetical protein FRC08_007616 [Ceratobasidium sp. 394]|nr:hypothetical protein FRC08_007616 [Ceratobasidium sp. 394]KAG9083457.1 hypothetical protein FS749_006018 [Ceratobasidium sp. UAMH 11750]